MSGARKELSLWLVAFAIIFQIASHSTMTAQSQASAALRVKTDASDVTIWLDGADVGRTPLTLRTVASGKHGVVLTKDGYEDHLQEIEGSAESDEFDLRRDEAAEAQAAGFTGRVQGDPSTSHRNVHRHADCFV
jgi:hypothetical protein